jgi:hypothetical protein
MTQRENLRKNCQSSCSNQHQLPAIKLKQFAGILEFTSKNFDISG